MTAPIIRGYARTKEQTADLVKHGLADAVIYQDGRRGECLDACLDSFRHRRGRLIIATDLRALGKTKRAVAEAMAGLEKSGIHVTDISHPEDTTVAEMVQRAQSKISGGRFDDRRTARRQGARGGLGKGVSASMVRDSMAPKWVVDRIVDSRDIPWALKLEILSPHFSEATLRRHYGSMATGKPK